MNPSPKRIPQTPTQMSTETTHDDPGPVKPAKRNTAPAAPELRPHTFDGIQEFDQPLPNWWLWTLYAAIIWTFVSWFWEFQLTRPLNMAKSDTERVDTEVAAVKKQQADSLAKVLDKLDDARFWELSRDKEMTARGQATFEAICSACHAKDMSATMPGGIKLPGLPLNDKEWKYGGKPMDVFKVVSKGSPDVSKGMISWEPQLGGAKIAEVVSYILSKHERAPDGTAQ